MSWAPLAEATVVLNGSGNGSVSAGPNRSRQRWSPPLTVAVSTSTAALIPVAKVTMGSSELGATYTGSSDSDDFPGVTVLPGQKITVTWTGGDPGAVAKATITGNLETF